MSNMMRYAENIYNALLSLYPVQFRLRFGPEMMQLFRDCSRDALEKGEVAVLIAFCIQAVRDLAVSVVRERGREIWSSPVDADHPVMTVVDALLIPSIVTANLMVLGPILTLLVQGIPAVNAPIEQFMLTSGMVSFAIGCLTVLASIIITRLRPTARLWVKLSA